MRERQPEYPPEYDDYYDEEEEGVSCHTCIDADTSIHDSPCDICRAGDRYVAKDIFFNQRRAIGGHPTTPTV